jgi:hypothetical protein
MAGKPGMPSPKTRRHFKIDQLPEPLIANVRELLERGHTYNEIARHLAALGEPVSASAVRRYGVQFLERQRRVAETADKAAQLIGKVGNTDMEEAASRLSLELLVRWLLDCSQLDNLDDVLHTLQTLARVQTAAVTREKWKTEVAKRAAAAASDAAQIARQGGLSDSAVELIRKRILGISETEGSA